MHFVKTKSYNKNNLELDKNISLKFKDRIINHTDGSYFKLMTIFFCLTMLMLAVTYYVYSKTKNFDGFIALILITVLCGLAFIFFTYRHFYENDALKCGSDLFVIYDAQQVPCAVEIKRNQVKVLYKDCLYHIKDGKLKKITDNNKLYLAYLNMYSLSLFDIEKHVSNLYSYSVDYDLIFLPFIKYLDDGSNILMLSNIKTKEKDNNVNTRLVSTKSANKFLHFNKYIFITNKQLKLQSVCYNAKENNLLLQNITTFADIVERGDKA